MRNFGRALKDALRYWPSILTATLCSLVVAALWGANIGACYPILELTLKGDSISGWMTKQGQEAKEKKTKLEAELKQLPAEQPGEPQPIRNQRAALKSNIATQQAAIERTAKLQPWVDKYVPRDPFRTVSLIIGILMVSTLIKQLFLMANDLLVARVAVDISRSIRQRIFNRAVEMDRGTLSQLGTAGISAKMTHTSEMLSNALMNTLGGAIREPLKIVSCLVGASLICWRLLLLSMFVAPLAGALLYWITRRLKAISQGVLNRSSTFHKVMLESLGNIQTTQAYTMEDFEKNRFAKATGELRRNCLKFVFYSTLAKPIIELLGLMMLGTAIIGGAYLVLNQQTHLFGVPICNEPLTVPALLVFFGMLIGVSDPLRKLSTVYSTIYAGTVAADSLYPMLDRESLIRDPQQPKTSPTPHKVLQMRNVTFGYMEDQTLLDDVSLEVPFGATIALVGHNGSGKSTLVNLLCRFYDPREGSLALDGVDLRDLRLVDLRKRIALVTQNTELFNESVTFNIRYGSPEATNEQVVAAAQQAHAHEFITEALEKKYYTFVGQNGQRLSGGQRQRIALARAILRDPEILILDEATSQIDMQSEQLIRESLAAHRGKRTMIIITHREALLDLADRIYEVRDGKLWLRERTRQAA
jgi:ATP-binding cassette subfamily B protein/subfamily B ATP-binding cassette protein MsbA